MMPYKDPEVRRAFQAERHKRRKEEAGFREARRESEKKYAASDKGRERSVRGEKTDRERHPERHRARQMLRYAVRSGKIKRQPCQVCGDEKSQGHHEDYNKPLDVQWFCQAHHPR